MCSGQWQDVNDGVQQIDVFLSCKLCVIQMTATCSKTLCDKNKTGNDLHF